MPRVSVSHSGHLYTRLSDARNFSKNVELIRSRGLQHATCSIEVPALYTDESVLLARMALVNSGIHCALSVSICWKLVV